MKNFFQKTVVFLLFLSLLFWNTACQGKPKSNDRDGAALEVAGEMLNEVGRREDIGALLDQNLQVETVDLETGKVENPVTIIQITDSHINLCDEIDFQENNPSTMSTYRQRDWLKNGASLENLDIALKYGSYFDQTVLTGDTIDYLSHGALSAIQNHVFKPYPNVLCAIGNHDSVRVMGLSDDVADSTTSEERHQLLQSVWPHNIYYASKWVRDSVLVIQLHNGTGTFYESQIELLKDDLAQARQKNAPVLLFYHIPLPLQTDTEPTKAVYEIIRNNADVITAAFCGHTHNSGRTDIPARCANGMQKDIPQYILTANAYDSGYVCQINVR